MFLVRAQDESVINSAYVKSWELNFDAETRIMCHIAGECKPRVLYDAELDDHPDAHDAVVRAYDDMLLFLSGSESIQNTEDRDLRYFDLSVSVRSHRQ